MHSLHRLQILGFFYPPLHRLDLGLSSDDAYFKWSNIPLKEVTVNDQYTSDVDSIVKVCWLTWPLNNMAEEGKYTYSVWLKHCEKVRDICQFKEEKAIIKYESSLNFSYSNKVNGWQLLKILSTLLQWRDFVINSI